MAAILTTEKGSFPRAARKLFEGTVLEWHAL
jgi:hypothetical protein